MTSAAAQSAEKLEGSTQQTPHQVYETKCSDSITRPGQ